MMTNNYYEQMKVLAREKRQLYSVNTSTFGLREVRNIYKIEKITIDHYPLPARIKAVYMCSNNDCSVAIRKSLPMEPKLFALVHELKHHYCDQELIEAGLIHCGDYNQNEHIEIGAEIFSAEFIYPVAEFSEDIKRLNVNTWQPEDIVLLKRNCKAKVSYQYLCKRLEFLRLIPKNKFKGLQFKKLEEKIYGKPFYKR